MTVRSCSPSRNALCDLSGMRLISSSRITSADASGPNSVTSSPVAGLIIWKPTTSVGCRSARPWMRANLALLIAARMTPKKVLPTPGTPRKQQVAGVDLPLLVLVVGRRNLGEQDDVRERLGGVVTDERLAAFRDDGLVELDGFLEVRMHDKRQILSCFGGRQYARTPS